MPSRDDLWNIYNNTQACIRLADQKVQVLLVICGGISAVVFSRFADAKSTGCVMKVMLIAYLVVFAVFLVVAMSALLARSDRTTGLNVPKLVYFDHVSGRKEPAEYYEAIKGLEEDQMVQDISYQIYEVSQIATTKFARYKAAWILLSIEILIFVLIMIGSVM